MNSEEYNELMTHIRSLRSELSMLDRNNTNENNDKDVIKRLDSLKQINDHLNLKSVELEFAIKNDIPEKINEIFNQVDHIVENKKETLVESLNDFKSNLMEELERYTKKKNEEIINDISELDDRLMELTSGNIKEDNTLLNKVPELEKEINKLQDLLKTIKNNHNIILKNLVHQKNINIDDKIVELKDWIHKYFESLDVVNSTVFKTAMRKIPTNIEVDIVIEKLENEIKKLKRNRINTISKEEVIQLLNSNNVVTDKKLLTYSIDDLDKKIKKLSTKKEMFDGFDKLYTKSEVDSLLMNYVHKSQMIDILNEYDKKLEKLLSKEEFEEFMRNKEVFIDV